VPARYQCYQLEQGWFWRLLGANNRALAHNPSPLSDQQAAIADVSGVAALAADAPIDVVADGRTWRWVLLDQGTVRAVSTISYARRPDCVRAVTRFRRSAVLAPVSEEPLVAAHSSE